MLNVINTVSDVEEDGIQESHILLGDKILRNFVLRVSSNFSTCKVVILLAACRRLKPLV